MRRVELEVEHHYKNRFVGRHILKPGSELTVLGASRDAEVRLLGDGVNGVHAALEYEEDQWVLLDLGSEQGTWVQRKPVVRQPIRSTTQVRIGGHLLKLKPKEIESHLFRDSDASKQADGPSQFHQVIVRKNGLVVKSYLLHLSETFHYRHGGEVHKLTPPPGAEWVKNEFGDVVVQQRLIGTDVLEERPVEKLQSFMDPSLRVPMMGSALAALLVFALLLLSPSRPDNELKELDLEENRYSRIIYDSKKTESIKKNSDRLVKNMKGRQQKKSQARADNSKSPDSKGSPSKTVSKIKDAGISKMVGKISKRAADIKTVVRASGVAAGSRPSGRALAQAGSIKKAAGESGTGEKHKIAGVSTDGKAGGSKSYKGVGGLARGNVGNADVGVLEEETDIQGGLEREVIARVIKSQLGQIRYCYERQLSANPDIYGKVQVKFTIGPEGDVVQQKVGGSTLKKSMVEGCVLRRIASWKFPTPKGGTSVLVTYPFLFKSTN